MIPTTIKMSYIIFLIYVLHIHIGFADKNSNTVTQHEKYLSVFKLKRSFQMRISKHSTRNIIYYILRILFNMLKNNELEI